MFGDARKAIAAYNWGEGNVQADVARWGSAWDQHLPRETTGYLARVTGGLAMTGGSRWGGHSGGGGGSQTNIGQITIHTQATDAKGIARDMRVELSRYGFVMQANTGLA